MANQYDTNLKLQAIADAIGNTSSSGLISALEDIADAVAGGGGGGSSTAGLVSDNFSETDTYDLGDYCIHNNTLYVCINAITTPGAWDLSDWQATNAGIQLSSLNSALVDISDYDILYDGVSSTAGAWQTTSLNSGKKFSDYKFVIVQIMQYDNAYNASVFEPLSVFKTQISTDSRIIVFGDTNVNSQVYYISDTTFGLVMSVVTGGFKTRIYGFMKV